jgi:hypothetical protein
MRDARDYDDTCQYQAAACEDRIIPRSFNISTPRAHIDLPVRILSENVVTVLHQGVTREAAFRVMSLRS